MVQTSIVQLRICEQAVVRAQNTTGGSELNVLDKHLAQGEIHPARAGQLAKQV